jgi:hypothetical protein
MIDIPNVQDDARFIALVGRIEALGAEEGRLRGELGRAEAAARSAPSGPARAQQLAAWYASGGDSSSRPAGEPDHARIAVALGEDLAAVTKARDMLRQQQGELRRAIGLEVLESARPAYRDLVGDIHEKAVGLVAALEAEAAFVAKLQESGIDVRTLARVTLPFGREQVARLEEAARQHYGSELGGS